MGIFLGRDIGLEPLGWPLKKPTARLLVARGRRGAGKSLLIAEFTRPYRLPSITGLPPTQRSTRESELAEFSRHVGDILRSTAFAGRVSRALSLEELSLSACGRFWPDPCGHISAPEKARLLAATGEVPAYLEHIDKNSTAGHDPADRLHSWRTAGGRFQTDLQRFPVCTTVRPAGPPSGS